MPRIVRVNSSQFFRKGKLIARKNYTKLIRITSLKTAKKRVAVLKKALEKVKMLTANDAEGMEYGLAVNKIRKQGKVQINRGTLTIKEDGRKVPSVAIPDVKAEKSY